MINFRRKQILLELWQDDMVKDIAKKKDCSFSEATRYALCFTILNYKKFISLRKNYADLNFRARIAYENKEG